MYKVLVGKPEGRRPLGRPRRRWEDGVRIDLREIGSHFSSLSSPFVTAFSHFVYI
jgi:hypothetical protein